MDLELHIEPIKHQLKVLVTHHFVQNLNHILVLQVSLHNIRELYTHPQNKHLKLYNYLRIHWLQDFPGRTLEEVLLTPEGLHKYQTYHFDLERGLPRYQHVRGKNLLHHYTLNHLDRGYNLLVPSHHLIFLHHRHGKMHILPERSPLNIQTNQSYPHRKSFHLVLLQRTPGLDLFRRLNNRQGLLHNMHHLLQTHRRQIQVHLHIQVTKFVHHNNLVLHYFL